VEDRERKSRIEHNLDDEEFDEFGVKKYKLKNPK